jgi:YD repeat-containing protein
MTLTEDKNGNLVLLREAPPLIQPPSARGPLLITTPDGATHRLEWEDAAELHRRLGQQLAFGMRRRESSAPPIDPSPGGTPAAIRMAA